MSKGRVYLVLGAVLAAISGVLVFVTVQHAKPKPVTTRPVLVAVQQIPPRTYITPDASKTLFRIANWPVDIAPANALSSPTQTTDHVIVGSVEKDAPVFLTNLSSDQTAGQTGLSIDIPADNVALSVPISQVNTAGGAISPGDYVDILISVNAAPAAGSEAAQQAQAAASKSTDSKDNKELVSLTTLQHVKVLAMGQDMTPAGSQSAPASGKSGSSSSGSSNSSAQSSNATAATMTLLLSHQDALLLKYAKDNGGMIDMALRRYDDPKTGKTDPVDLNYFLEHFGYHMIAPTK